MGKVGHRFVLSPWSGKGIAGLTNFHPKNKAGHRLSCCGKEKNIARVLFLCIISKSAHQLFQIIATQWPSRAGNHRVHQYFKVLQEAPLISKFCREILLRFLILEIGLVDDYFRVLSRLLEGLKPTQIDSDYSRDGDDGGDPRYEIL